MVQGFGKSRVCGQCGTLRGSRCMVWCSICRRWFCEDCHRDDHVWQCAEENGDKEAPKETGTGGATKPAAYSVA
jgi:hypothetical protein